MTPGERLRTEALDRAIRCSKDVDSAEEIITAAKKFEEYLKSGTGTTDD